jgi:hypothetical protein
MNATIATGICMIASLVATFLLFATAFNTPFSDLRSSFMPIYLGLVVVCSIACLLAPRRLTVILVSALFLPILILAYVASQRASYYIDAAVLVLSCSIAGACASQAARRRKKPSLPVTKKSGEQAAP